MRVTTLAITLAGLVWAASVHAQDTFHLRESFPAGYQYHVSTRVDLQGTLNLPAPMTKAGQPTSLPVSGSSSVEYDERILDEETATAKSRTLRHYSRLDFRRKLGEQVQESNLRPQVRRMVLLRMNQSEVPFSPDGPLTWSEIDRVRTDVFTPALRGLLPEKAVRVGDQWAASTAAAQELSDLDQIKGGQLNCKFHEVVTRNGRKFAHVKLSGTLSGVNEDGPNRQQIEGYLLFDLEGKFLSYVYVDGTSWLLDKDDKAQGRVDGRFTLTRRIATSPDLSDEVIRSLTLEPNDDNTLLLFQEAALGVEFTYPRRWTVNKADARQIVLDEPGGGGLVITLEPLAQTPSGQEFQAEARKVLEKRSARMLRQDPVQRLSEAGTTLEHFGFEAEIEKTTWLLDYYVSRQAMAGATFMGRWPAKAGSDLRKECERIARSLKLNPPRK